MTKKKTVKRKVHLIFNESERRDYLLGFRKRKEARKLKVKEELQKQLKDEKKKIKNEQKDVLKKMLLSQRTVPEIEHLVEPVTYDLPEHTVTIAEVDIEDRLQSVNEDIEKSNKMESEDLQHSNSDHDTADSNMKGNLTKKLKLQRIEAYRKSTAFSASKILQKKKDKKKAKQQKLLLRRESKKTKKNKSKKKKK